jgi:hypothetical protein
VKRAAIVVGLAALYAAYAVLVVGSCMWVDFPRLLERVQPFPHRTEYHLEDNDFIHFEAYSPPWTIRRVPSYKNYELFILKGNVPSLDGIDPADYFSDPSFRPESAVWNPDDRYEKDFIFSVKLPLAKVCLFGDSYLVSTEYKAYSYLLNEEYGIPTFRRTFYGRPGPMELIYDFVAHTPEETIRDKTVVIEISEGGTPRFISTQTIGTSPYRAARWLVGSWLYRVGSWIPLDRWLHRRDDPGLPPPMAGVERRPECETTSGRTIRDDPKHLNPVLFAFNGECRAMGLYHRDLNLMTRVGLLLDGYAPRVSMENWLRRIAGRARERGVRVVVLYIPTRLSSYWSILAPILDYEKGLAYLRKHRGFNETIHTARSLRDTLTAGRSVWRDLYTRICREEGMEMIDLTEPFREATMRGVKVHSDFGTHWTYEGLRLAADETARYLREHPR